MAPAGRAWLAVVVTHREVVVVVTYVWLQVPKQCQGPPARGPRRPSVLSCLPDPEDGGSRTTRNRPTWHQRLVGPRGRLSAEPPKEGVGRPGGRSGRDLRRRSSRRPPGNCLRWLQAVGIPWRTCQSPREELCPDFPVSPPPSALPPPLANVPTHTAEEGAPDLT